MLDGKVAIVTGAGHGIGRGHALELAKHGAKVVVNDLGVSVKGEGQGKDADLTVDIITERGGEAVANYENVADYEGAGRMVAQAVDTFGKLDVLVNNAGIVRDSAIWNMSEADFDAVLNVHVKGTWRRATGPPATGETATRPARPSPAGSSTPPRAPVWWATSARPTTPRPRPASPA